jgi:hypothetical protein
MQGVEAIADAVTGENERLKEFGITTKVAGDQITYNWNENGKAMSKTVRKNGQDITAALLEIFGRFDGAMDNLSKTQEGVIANLGDEWTGFLKRIAEKGYYDDVTRRLNGLKGNIEQWDKDGTLDRAAQAVSGFLTGSIELGVHIGRQLFAVGQGAFRAASGITELISRVTGLNSVASAGVLGAAVLGSSAMGRGMMIALARRMPALAGLLAVDELITGLRGGDTYIGQLEGGQEAIDGLREKFAALAEAIESVADAAALKIDWSQFETPSDFLNTEIVRFVEDLNKLVAELTAVFNAIANGITTVREAMGNFAAGGGITAPEPNAPLDYLNRFSGGRLVPPAADPAPRSTPRSGGRIGTQSSYIDDRISAAFANAQGNLAKMQGGAPVEAVANDNSVDNRNQSVTVNSTVNQTIQQPSAAPAAVGAATSRAVAGAAPPAARLITGNAR